MKKQQQLFVIRSSQGTIFVDLNTGWAVQITPSDDATDFASIENIHKFNLNEREEYRKEDILENDNLDILDFGYWFGGDPENPLTWTYVEPDQIWRTLMVELNKSGVEKNVKKIKGEYNKRQVECYDAFPNALGGYDKLVKILTAGSQPVTSTIETDVEFEHIPDHQFTLRCYDGIAVGTSEDKTVNVVLEYPTRLTLTKDEANDVLEYRGKRSTKPTFGDIMLRLGKVTLVHYVKK